MHIAEAETEEKKTGCYRHTEMQRDLIIEKLKEKGFRITRQRKILLDIILEGECSCCKEIYYKAVREDPSIGIATVYRMVKTLEEIGAIDRKNLYRISCEENCEFQEGCILVLKNKEKVTLSMEDFREAVNEVLRRKGYREENDVEAVIWKDGSLVEGV